MVLFRTRLLLSASLIAGFTCAANAQGLDDNDPDVIQIWGRGLDQIGEASAATEGIVGYEDFATRPIGRVGELVEVIPGMIATQHSGTGKANQYFMRGFNLDHGTDFAAYIDGAPVNMRSHGHGQGYLDLNPLIPEFVAEVRYRKGAYRASDGDFSLAGSARFRYYDALPENFASLEAGEFGYARAASGFSHSLPAGTLTLGGEYVTYDGPWSVDEDAERVNLIGRYAGRALSGDASLTLTVYDADWRGADQLPERAVSTFGRFGVIDPTLGGSSQRFAATARWERDAITLGAYAIRSDFTLFSNFTYFLEDPVNGDQFEQRDERWVLGGYYSQHAHLSDQLDIAWGAELRHDAIEEIGLYRTQARQRLGTIRTDEIDETSLSGYAELTWSPRPDLRLTGGLRADYIEVDVTALSLPQNGGTADDSLIAPKLGAAWTVTPDFELYANYGRGFHSNDARGVTITVDPTSAHSVSPAAHLDPAVTHHPHSKSAFHAAESAPLIVPGDGAELGARWEAHGVNLTVAAFWLELDSELVFVGDGGATEANDGSERFGVEAAAFWEINDWLVADFQAAWTDARFVGVGPDDRIPGAVETVLSGGVVATGERYAVSARIRHFGEAPLVEDGSITSDATTLVNLGGEYSLGPIVLTADIFNLFDAEDADITYFYESRLAGEPAGIEERHFRSVEPRQLRAGLRWAF